MKMIFKIFNKAKKELPLNEVPRISRDELREFLINNHLTGDLFKKVSNLKEKYSDLSNYEAVEFLLDRQQ